MTWKESRVIFPYGKPPAAGEYRSGESTNIALKGVFPAQLVSGDHGQFQRMQKNHLIRVKRIQIK